MAPSSKFYRQMFPGQPPMAAAQARSWARRQQGCYKLAGARCPVTFPSTLHSCVLRRSTSRGSRGYYHYVYVSGRVNYTSDGRRGRKGERERERKKERVHAVNLSSPRLSVSGSVYVSDILSGCFLGCLRMCLCECTGCSTGSERK